MQHERRRAARGAARSHRPAAPRRERVREADRRARSCCDRRSSGPQAFDDAFRDVHAALGVQASDAGGLLPDDGRRRRPPARLVLARVVPREPALRPGDRHGASRSRSATRPIVAVLYGNRARGVLPIRARFTFTDGSTQDFDYPGRGVEHEHAALRPRVRVRGKKLTKIELDPDGSTDRRRPQRTTCGRARRHGYNRRRQPPHPASSGANPARCSRIACTNKSDIVRAPRGEKCVLSSTPSG